MPYISKESRKQLDDPGAWYPDSAGELAYSITKLVMDYLKGEDRNQKYCFEDIAEVLGVLDATRQEFYRRVVVPYETKKIKENGDVY